ncbi:MAG: transporter substrate-binding domain-containing protein [Clostridiales bacterium]
MKQYQYNNLCSNFFRYIYGLFFAILFCLVLCPSPLAAETDKPREVIRVGYPINPGLSEVDKNGNYSGYTYEYLQEIAQYTGWEYEFVQLSGSTNEVLTKMYDMLKTGDLDIIGSTNYSEDLDKIYDYPILNYGSVYNTLEVLDDNKRINEGNYQSLNNTKIAVLGHAKNGIAALNEFCENNNISPTFVYCENDKELTAALKEKKADALLYNDAAAFKGTRIVARFNPKPFYFATTNGNDKIITQLNSAMAMINDADPYFATTLYQKYFSHKVNTRGLTDAEEKYIDNVPTLKVGVTNDRLPLEDKSHNGTFQGISVDLMERIAQETGLKFQYVYIKSPDELLKSLETGKVDLSLGVTYDYNASQKYNFSMSKPYLSAQVVMAVKHGINPYELKGKKLALPRGTHYTGGYMGDVVYYDSVLECLQAVNDGKADYCYGNSYSVEYYCNLYHYPYLTLIPQSSQINKYCIGMARPGNPLLLTILNKSICNIPQGEFQSIVYSNSMPPNKVMTLRNFIEMHPFGTVIFFIIFTLVIVALFVYFAWFQKRARREVQIENERYKILADMSGEYLFEYDFAADTLKLTEKTAKLLGSDMILHNYFKNHVSIKDENSHWIKTVYNNMEKKKSMIAEHQVALANGRKTWLRITIASISDEKGKTNYFIGKIADIEAEKAEKDELSTRADTDGLTGLYNVGAARVLIEKALKDTGGTMLIIDMDNFKSINDRFGHYTGDEVLQGMSEVLQKVFRKDDIIARLGGDEFVIFVRAVTDKAIIEDRCHMLKINMDAYSKKWPMKVTMSIGAAIAGKNTDYYVLYQNADKRLYNVKESGRNGFLIDDTALLGGN